MSRSITHNPNPNWGGARPGAGRPKEPDALTKRITIRVKPEVFEFCREKGGSSFVRDIVDRALAPMAANNKGVPLGFDPVNAANFARPLVEHDRTIESPELMSAQCGFPSPAYDYEGEEISIFDMLVKHEDATFLVRAAGDSMIDAGIFEGDILLVDRALEARPGDIVLAYLRGEFTIKRLAFDNGRPELHPENEAENYPVIRPEPEDDFNVEGVVVSSIRRFRK